MAAAPEPKVTRGAVARTWPEDPGAAVPARPFRVHRHFREPASCRRWIERATGVDAMKSVVVYESHWGNTAAIADAIAAGIGPGTAVLTTDEATGRGARGRRPGRRRRTRDGVCGCRPSETLLGMPGDRKAPRAPDMSHASMRSWLDRLPAGTRPWRGVRDALRWITRRRHRRDRARPADGRLPTPGQGPRVRRDRRVGPLRDGELEAARAWGAELAATARVIAQLEPRRLSRQRKERNQP